MPNGSRWKQYLLIGVIMLLRSVLCRFSGIYQNSELASSVENTYTPTCCAIDCSTACRDWMPLPADTPVEVSTTTMPVHQSVCTFTGLITL